jgi:Baseplate J-like protein
MTSPAEREFDFYPRGQKREEILTNFRIGLRQMTNPDTGLPFTETEIATATAAGSRFWIEADAIDVVLLIEQQRAFWLADQVDPERASSAWLVDYHGRLWGETPLPATGGSGLVTLTGAPLTIFRGSTTIGDPTATSCTDPAGLRYQVQQDITLPFSGTAPTVLLAVDAGAATNLTAGAELTWADPPAGAAPKATVASDFSGGTDTETDVEFVARLEARIRRKPGAGNGSHVRGWARAASNAIDDACVYACAFHAGSTLVTILQKRAGVKGPTARIASVSTLLAATSYLVPPASPVFPARAHVVVVTPTPEATDVVLELSMTTGVASGWSDPAPWPPFGAGAATITNVDSPTIFRMQNLAAVPLGVIAPKLMIWNDATTRFESLAVTSVTQTSPIDFVVALQNPSTKALAVGDVISPDTNLRDLIGETVESYFDSLGPGEVLNLATDPRGHRALRYPRPNEELPFRAGSSITSWLNDALGFALSNAQLLSISKTAPSIPPTPIGGPRLLTAGRIGVYPGDL